MRTYATIRGTFWNRGSGKKLKGDHLGRELALYLMTCSQGTACGIFHIVLPTIAHEIGEPIEVIREALTRITEIAEYDEEAELCWVPNTAREQIGETMKPGDRRRVKLVRELEQFTGHPFVAAFVEKYAGPYGLSKDHLEVLNPPCDGASDGVQRIAAPPSTVQHSSGSDQVGGVGDADLVPCPSRSEMFTADIIADLAEKLEVSDAAIRDGIMGYVGFFQAGGGINERRKPYEWRKACRQSLVNRAKKGELTEPNKGDPKEVADRAAARAAEAERRDAEARARLQKSKEQSGGVNVSALTRGIG